MKIINSELFDQMLIDFLNILDEKGFRKVVIGLSGGLDSSVAALFATRAVGSENVHAYFMPYKSSDPKSKEDAELLANVAGISLEVLDITNAADALIHELGDVSPLRLGNILSRIRMNVLFDKSAEVEGIVLGTANKSEMLLGYITWFGDSACAVNLLGDLYKTQVRELATLLSVPESIVNKAPSADYYLGQTDEGDLGYAYDMIDRLLNLYYEQGMGDLDLADKYGEIFVKNILSRVKKNRYKRELPEVLSIGQRNI